MTQRSDQESVAFQYRREQVALQMAALYKAFADPELKDAEKEKLPTDTETSADQDTNFIVP